MNIDVPYGITKRIENIDMADARERITTALKAEGFGILTEIDVSKTLADKLGAKVDPYVILGACNPSLAHAAIQGEPGIGLLLPCNVVLTKEGDDVVVSAASPKAMFSIAAASAKLASIADDAEARISRAVHNA